MLGCPRGQDEWSGEQFLQRRLGSWHGAQNKGWHFPTFHCAVMGCEEFFFLFGTSLFLVEERQRVGDTPPQRSGPRAMSFRVTELLVFGHREMNHPRVALLTFRVTSSTESRTDRQACSLLTAQRYHRTHLRGSAKQASGRQGPGSDNCFSLPGWQPPSEFFSHSLSVWRS